MGKTSIEWTQFSVNPIRARLRGVKDSVGHFCVKVSPGCKNCYASRLQPRFGLPVFQEQRGALEPEVFLDEKKLEEVRKRKIPTTYFWCDMTDMFGEWVPSAWVDKCFATMALTPWHKHQVLTKRSARMREWFGLIDKAGLGSDGKAKERGMKNFSGTEVPWPLRNVILMVSAENQEQADKRIPDLLACPAVLRGVSVEPMLGPVDFVLRGIPGWDEDWKYDTLRGFEWASPRDEMEQPNAPKLDWIIVGGESGPKARPYDLAWPRAIIEQCQSAGVAVFHKQLGRRPVLGGDTVPRGPDGMPWPKHKKGGDMSEWPADLRVREMPKWP